VRIACITSILQVGICCSDETPTDGPSIGDALKELQAIRDKFQKHLCHKGGRHQLAEVWRIFVCCLEYMGNMVKAKTSGHLDMSCNWWLRDKFWVLLCFPILGFNMFL
jgi:hypothetical protein